MGVVNSQTILDRAAIILQDTSNVRWPAGELLSWLNDGQREIVGLAPDAYTRTENLLLSPGTKQTIPASGIRLIDIPRNMGVTGATPGRAIRPVDRAVLDAQRPDWHSESASTAVKHYTFDRRNPKVFYVYPPQPSVSGYVEITYSASPPDVSAGQAISIDDIYANALLDYVLYRAYSKDAEYTQNAERAQMHYKAALSSLSNKEGTDGTVEPVSGSSRPGLTGQ